MQTGGLDLIEDGQPLTERALREQVLRASQAGEFASGQTEYAGLVRRRIYAASERDVQDTLDLLLTVRGSKLGREVRLAQMAELLRQSLPPVSAGVTGKLAEGIERLDRHAQRLLLLGTQTEAARTVAEANYHATLAVARAAAGRQRDAERRATEARAALEAAHAEGDAKAAALQTAQSTEAELGREQETLRVDLEAVEAQVGGQKNVIGSTERRLGEVRATLEQHRSRLRHEREREERRQERRGAMQRAQVADTDALAELKHALAGRAWWQDEHSLERRTGELRAAELALKVSEQDTERLSERELAAAGAREQADSARHSLEECSAALDATLTRTGVVLAGRAEQLQWQGLGLNAEAVAAYVFALDTGTEVGSAFGVLTQSAAELRESAREHQGRSRDRLRALLAQQQELTGQHGTLLTQTEVPPPLPEGRAQALLALEAAGIEARPFYGLVKPAEKTPASKAATALGRVEGALLASGVLTALVVPSAQQNAALEVLRRAGLADTLLLPGPAVQANLSALLEPEEDAPDSILEVIQGLSRSLAGGQSTEGQGAGFTDDGGWVNGVLAGGAADQGVRFLGHAARERERERRLALLESELTEVRALLAGAQDDLDTLNRELALLEAELDYLRDPPDLSHERRTAARERDDAFQTLRLRAEAHEAALLALKGARQRAIGAGQALDSAFGPPALKEGAGRESLEAAQQDQREAAAQWTQTLNLRERLASAETELSHLAEILTEHAAEVQRLEAERSTHETTRDALQATRLDLRSQHDAPDAARLRARLNELLARERELNRSRTELIGQLTAAQERLNIVAERLPVLGRANTEAQAELERTGVLLAEARTAHPRLAAKRLAADRPEAADLNVTVTEQAVQAVQYELRERYDRARPLLEAPESYHPQYLPNGPRFFLQGETATPDALLAHLESELEAARTLLTDEEARVFHNELIRELVEELDRKQREAAAWVSRIRKTLAGLRFHDERLDLESRTLPPAGQPTQALARLIDGRIDPVHQSEIWWNGVREEVRGVVRQLQTGAGGAASSELSFAQELERSLDYRQWLNFAFISVTPGGRREITDRTFAQRSGGERSAVLYTFLFAALGARFDMLGPRVPRLIGLDEAFAGMDLANIGALYRVMADLDLSWIATSERRIDLSPELSGAATYQLIWVATSTGNSVGSLCFVWDGQKAQEGGRFGLME